MEATVKNRIYILDALRGLAVLGMILHHSYVLLNFTHGVEIEFFTSPAFYVLQSIFVGVFLLVSGICTNFSRNILRRGAIVFGAAILITLVTAVALPAVGMTGLEIYFGILHMFGLSMLLYGLLKPLFDKCGTVFLLLVSVTLYIGQSIWMAFVPYFESPFNFTMIFGFPSKHFYSADYYPLLPYFFLFVAGAMIGRWVREHRFPNWFYGFRCRPLEFVGRHSLVIYVIHQPIVFAVITAVYAMIDWIG